MINNTSKRYIGWFSTRHNKNGVFVLKPDKGGYELDLRLDLCNHSPSGFAWGYLGSGPAQLALAILADYYDAETALNGQIYQRFKEVAIAPLMGDMPFELTGEQIEQYMRELGQ